MNVQRGPGIETESSLAGRDVLSLEIEDLDGQRLAIDGIKAVLREGIAFDAQQPSGYLQPSG